MAGELLKNLTGIDIVHVPYKGSTGARNDIISGTIQILFDAVPTMMQMTESGRVRALGTSGRTRSPSLPNVPTIAETVPGFSATLWVGLMAPAGTPQPVIDRLNSEISKILAREDIRDSWRQQGAVPLVMTQAKFKTFIEGQIETWAKVVKDNHIALIR
jgi:tripartite-type tricarboxylate transporter receptor subunit TctC